MGQLPYRRQAPSSPYSRRGISVKTAGNHIQHIFEKTGVRTRSAATVWAFERHLVQSA